MSATPLPPLTLGRLVYLGWHRPLAAIRQSWREGGPLHQWITWRGRRAMWAAAPTLAPLPVDPRSGEEPQLVMLTGQTLWYQTAFCLHSFLRQSARRPPVRFLSDGTLAASEAATLLRLFPGSSFDEETAVLAELARRLPPAKFPKLRAQELRLVLIRKLTHVHGTGRGWRLFLDSDMIFNTPPRLLDQWLAAPNRPIFMTDVRNAYGYPLDVLAALAGTPVPERLNTGVCGLHADFLDWPMLENWIATLVAQHGTSYYMEQALFALALAGRPFLQLPAADYIVAPSPGQIRAPTAPLHHYVDLTKRGYFRHAWRHLAPAAHL